MTQKKVRSEPGPNRGRQLAGQDELYLPAHLMIARYNISKVTLDRWINRPSVALPRPVKIGRTRFWLLSEVLRWERECATARAAGQTPVVT